MNYFKPHEQKCKCKGKYCKGTKLFIPEFLDKLNQVRVLYGAMRVTSGVRCPDYNREKGGSETSWHKKGRAADISCRGGANKMRLIKAIIEVGGLSLGIYENFIHIHLLPDEKEVAFRGRY